jgi:hypothetical protein
MGWTIRGSNSIMDKNISSSSQCTDRLRGPSSLLFNGYLGFPGVKRLGHESDHHLHLGSTLGIRGAVPPLLLCAFMTWTRTTLHLSLPLILTNYFAANSNKSCTFLLLLIFAEVLRPKCGDMKRSVSFLSCRPS